MKYNTDDRKMIAWFEVSITIKYLTAFQVGVPLHYAIFR